MSETHREDDQLEVIEDFDVTLETLDRQKAKLIALVGDDPAVVASIEKLESLAIDYGQKLSY